MTLADAQREYQLALERHRRACDLGVDEDDDVVALHEADRALEVAWLEEQAAA